MRRRVFRVLSYVPLTGPYRAYRDTLDYLDSVDALAARTLPDYTPFPRPVPRDAGECRYAVEAALSLVHGLEALSRGVPGPDAAALMAEHAPERSHP